MRLLIFTIALLTAAFAPGATTLLAASRLPPGFTTIYNGYGSVTWDKRIKTLALSPKAATVPAETHAALVISKQSLKPPYQINFRMKTAAQLRTGSLPNPWEVGWFVFGYKPDGRFKYLILKPAGYGLELGESLGNDKQNFLHTSAPGEFSFPVATAYDVVMTVRRGSLVVAINGKQYLKYARSDKDNLNFTGKYGFYTEDAAVEFSRFSVKKL